MTMPQQLCDTRKRGFGIPKCFPLSPASTLTPLRTSTKEPSDRQQTLPEKYHHLRKSTPLAPSPHYQSLMPPPPATTTSAGHYHPASQQTAHVTETAPVMVWSCCRCTQANGNTVKICVYKWCGHARCTDGCVPAPLSSASSKSHPTHATFPPLRVPSPALSGLGIHTGPGEPRAPLNRRGPPLRTLPRFPPPP